MDYVRFGNTGLTVSRLCLGCMTYGDPGWREWVLDEEASRPFLRDALERGINFFDTANMYSLGKSEEVVGRALNEMARRDEVVIATKVFNAMGPKPNQRGLSRKHIMEAIDASLRRLGTDYVDLYIIHRFDPDTPVEETIEALSDVVKAGKALYLGASSMWAWQFMKMLGLQRANGLAPFVSMQNFVNLIYREEEREMLPLCRTEGIAVTPWSPLGAWLSRRQPAQAGRSDGPGPHRQPAGIPRHRIRAGLCDCRARGRSRRTPRLQAGAGGARLGARAPGRDRRRSWEPRRLTISTTPSARFEYSSIRRPGRIWRNLMRHGWSRDILERCRMARSVGASGAWNGLADRHDPLAARVIPCVTARRSFFRRSLLACSLMTRSSES